MRVGQFLSGYVSLALLLGAGQAPLAQSSAAVVNGRAGTGFSVGVASPLGRTPGPYRPYSFTRTTTRVKKLADGTTITHESTEKVAFDSNGRGYRESRREPPMGSKGDAENSIVVNVSDPVNRTSIFWDSKTGEAIVTHFPDPREVKRPDPNPEQAVAGSAPMPKIGLIPPHLEYLGIKTINGIRAGGNRITRVIPAGTEGNEQPVTVTSEQWISVDFGLEMMSMTDDPRTGKSTTELTELEWGEPDPALFQVPEGYTVKDRTLEPQN